MKKLLSLYNKAMNLLAIPFRDLLLGSSTKDRAPTDSTPSSLQFSNRFRFHPLFGDLSMGNHFWFMVTLGTVLGFTSFLHSTDSAWALGTRPSLSSLTIQLHPIITVELEKPVFLTVAGDSHQLYVVEQQGRIRLIDKGVLQPHAFLDITEKISFGGERGLLGLAFHPQYKTNGRFFVNYTRAQDGATVIAEFRASLKSGSASPSNEQTLLVIPQPFGNHNGGMIAFGPDGFLYIAMGDGGAGGDPDNRGQNPTELLGKILRIDIDHGSPYAVPDDNPFAKKAQGQAVYALGFRNPWRFSFDRQSGDLWVADVGQNKWEEINRVERGKNYGWRVMEGAHCFNPSPNCSSKNLALPVAEYMNTSPRCAITGGYAYRGQGIPTLRGQYLFADFCSGEIMSLVGTRIEVLLNTGLHISSFGEDKEGELYVVDHGGGIYKITTPPRTP